MFSFLLKGDTSADLCFQLDNPFGRLLVHGLAPSNSRNGKVQVEEVRVYFRGSKSRQQQAASQLLQVLRECNGDVPLVSLPYPVALPLSKWQGNNIEFYVLESKCLEMLCT